MNGIDLLVEEHILIKRALKVIRKLSLKVLEEDVIEYDDFYTLIDFVVNFADLHHHGKEEKFLFNEMIDEIGEVAVKLIRNGMLVEHDLGRLYISQLRTALDESKNGSNDAKLNIIANAIGYTNLLERHIDKEDNVVYKFASEQLKCETMDKFNENCLIFEDSDKNKKIRKLYIKYLDELEIKYI